jgi:hypothetical protein
MEMIIIATRKVADVVPRIRHDEVEAGFVHDLLQSLIIEGKPHRLLQAVPNDLE